MGAVSKFASKAYLERKLRDFIRVKSYTEEQLDKHLAEIDPPPFFHTKPMISQKASFLIGAYKAYWLFFSDPGTGKSKLILDLIAHWKRKRNLGKTLILIPNVVAIDSWVEQCQEHAPLLKYVPLYGSTEERRSLIENTDADVYILNYAGLVYLATTRGKTTKGKGAQILDKEKILWIQQQFDGLVLDESHNCKSWSSLSYQILNSIADSFTIRYGMTGTPFGRDPHDLWPQFKLIDRGETFGANLTLFRHVFFTQSSGYFGGREYKFKRQMEKKLHTMMRNRSIRYSADECSDLPELSRQAIHVPMPEGSKEFYKTVVKSVVDAAINNTKKENAFMGMRQISSGFMNVGEGEERERITFPNNPKLEALCAYVDGLPITEKFVVFNEFIYSGDMICAELDKLGVKYARLYSGTKDPIAEIQRFKTDPECRGLVANSQSGGTALNLQIARYVLFYESPVSPIVRAQAEARVYRKGQVRHSFIIDFVTKGTMDVKILAYLEEGADLFEALCEGREEWQDDLFEDAA